MVDEQELPGASDDATDAPSLQVARSSGRPRAPTKRLLESQDQHKATKASQRKPKRQFTVNEELLSPPSTQATSFVSQNLSEGGNPSISQPKKRLRVSKTKPAAASENTDDWEHDFEAAPDKSRKFQVLLEALGCEDFPQRMSIPKRVGTANLDGQKLDPLDPLAIWSRFVFPQRLQIIAEHTNGYEAVQYSTNTHSAEERVWKDISGADIGAYLGAAMLTGVQPQTRIADYWNTSSHKPIFPIQQYITRQSFQQISRYLKVSNPHENVPEKRFFDKLEPLLSSFKDASQKLVNLPDTVSIDENLIASRTRTVHLMQIDNKAAGKGFKI